MITEAEDKIESKALKGEDLGVNLGAGMIIGVEMISLQEMEVRCRFRREPVLHLINTQIHFEMGDRYLWVICRSR